MGSPTRVDEERHARRLLRIRAELDDIGFPFDGSDRWQAIVLEEIGHAVHPRLHERRVASMGAIIDPTSDLSIWRAGTDLEIVERPIGEQPLSWARRFADGLSSWVVRRSDGADAWAVFDRPAGSERDLGVLSEVLGATIVQRHPTGSVRVVGPGGVWRWERFDWHHEPPVAAWIDAVTVCPEHGDPRVLGALLEFAVHDLGAWGVGATLVYRPDTDPGPPIEARLPLPPPLDIRRPLSLSPLRHALAQIDGASVFDGAGRLRQVGVRLVPSAHAERTVPGLKGMRHTSARRYSVDDPLATLVVVSEDGPVTVFRNGEVLGVSPAPDDDDDED